MLFVGKKTLIVIYFERVLFITALAESWLYNFATFNKTLFLSLTALTDKCGFFHFRNHITATDYNTSQSNKFFNMRWVHFSDSVDFSKIKWPDLNQYVFHFLVVLSIIWQIGSDFVMVNLIATYIADRVKLELFVNLSCY
jgi:hypothetical protein